MYGDNYVHALWSWFINAILYPDKIYAFSSGKSVCWVHFFIQFFYVKAKTCRKMLANHLYNVRQTNATLYSLLFTSRLRLWTTDSNSEFVKLLRLLTNLMSY